MSLFKKKKALQIASPTPAPIAESPADISNVSEAEDAPMEDATVEDTTVEDAPIEDAPMEADRPNPSVPSLSGGLSPSQSAQIEKAFSPTLLPLCDFCKEEGKLVQGEFVAIEGRMENGQFILPHRNSACREHYLLQFRRKYPGEPLPLV